MAFSGSFTILNYFRIRAGFGPELVGPLTTLDHRASMKQDLLDAILFLRANGQLDEETIRLMESMRS